MRTLGTYLAQLILDRSPSAPNAAVASEEAVPAWTPERAAAWRAWAERPIDPLLRVDPDGYEPGRDRAPAPSSSSTATWSSSGSARGATRS